jgi:cbb3-type cytochrome oxidase subunit 3
VSIAVFVTVVLVLCGLGVVLIVVGPSRRVRAEQPLDPDAEAALLLGEDPELVEEELEAREQDESAERRRERERERRDAG